jgi:hypothetical protein
MEAEEALAVDLETQKAWARQWREAGEALERVRRAELRRLTPARALAASNDLLSLRTRLPLPPERRTGSGLVEQQRLLQRGRR